MGRRLPSVGSSGTAARPIRPWPYPTATSFLLPVVADVRRLRVNVRAEVPQAHEDLGSGVLEGHPVAGSLLGDEDLVAGDLAVADVDRAIDVELADSPAPLGDDQAGRSVVLDRHRAAGID